MEQQALLKRIAELSRLVNAAEAPKAKRHKSANRVYVRTDPAPAVVATSHLVPATPVVAQQTVSSPRMTRRHDFASNARWKPRPPPISRSKLREYKVTQKKQKKAKGQHRVAIFSGNGIDSYRKTRVNVLQRSVSVGNKSLKVPKPPKAKPVCSFFLRGECVREDCAYSHVFEGKKEDLPPLLPDPAKKRAKELPQPQLPMSPNVDHEERNELDKSFIHL